MLGVSDTPSSNGDFWILHNAVENKNDWEREQIPLSQSFTAKFISKMM